MSQGNICPWEQNNIKWDEISPSLCICLSVCLSVYFPMVLSLCLFLFVSASVSVCISVCLCLSVSLSLCLSVFASVCLYVCLCLSVSVSVSLFLSLTCVCPWVEQYILYMVCFDNHIYLHYLIYSSNKIWFNKPVQDIFREYETKGPVTLLCSTAELSLVH